jgi:CheY-like chemotaxis protein
VGRPVLGHAPLPILRRVEGTLIRRILLVEDDEGMRDAIRALLERAGFHVAAAHDGAEAWELLSRGPRPAAVLADLYMPRMTGHDLVARIRRTPRLAAIPVIAMSGERERRDCPAAEAFLEKPFSREQLEWALDRVGA